MRFAYPGFQPTGKPLIGEHRIEENRQLRDRHGVPFRRNAGMEVGERFFIRKRREFLEGGREQVERLGGACLEMLEPLTPVRAVMLFGPFNQRPLGPSGCIQRWQPQQGEIIEALEARA